MSSEDPVRPYHAKDEARGQEAAEAVAAVLKHAAEKEQVAQAKPRPKKQPKWMLPLGLNLAVIAVYLLLAPPTWVTVNPIEGPDQATQVQGLRVALYLQAQQIEAYKDQNGRLPSSLAESGRAVPGIEYVRQGAEQYQLVATVGDQPIVYDSSGPNPEIVAAVTASRLGG
ncbi:MAG: hypothetical protein AMXMBFR53_26790 [Gemmatimonadota bacterium]